MAEAKIGQREEVTRPKWSDGIAVASIGTSLGIIHMITRFGHFTNTTLH